MPYSYDDVNRFEAKPHGRLLEGPHGKELYKKTTDEVLAISAALTDEQKVTSISNTSSALCFNDVDDNIVNIYKCLSLPI